MITIILINGVVVALAVIIHYNFLTRMTVWMPKLDTRPRFKIILGVFGALIAHAVEVWVFALSYYFLHQFERWGSLEGNFDGSLLDCIYFSFSTFTTLGFGDIQPMGALRYLTGIESLTGLVLITWSASFLFYGMQKYWSSE